MLDGKVALVTGASRGIGRAVAQLFSQNGATVYAGLYNPGFYNPDCSDDFKDNKNIIPQHYDVTDSNAVKSAFMQIKKEQGRLDILVNNAGIMKDALIGMISAESLKETYDVNVFAVVELIQLASKFMIKQSSGSIINIASMVGVNGNIGQLAYSGSKGAVIAMTKSAAKELAQYNIRVNAIAPGMIDTELLHSIGEERVAERTKAIGMQRLGTPNDIAEACMFFASDASAYITGQVLGIDGG